MQNQKNITKGTNMSIQQRLLVLNLDICSLLQKYLTSHQKIAFANLFPEKDKHFLLLMALSNDGNALQYTPDDIRDDKKLVLASVSSNGNALQHVSDRLRNDKEVVLAAVSNNGNALQYV